MKNRASTNPEVLLSELSECADIIDEKDKRIKELEALPKKMLEQLRNCRALYGQGLLAVEWEDIERIFKENGVEL